MQIYEMFLLVSVILLAFKNLINITKFQKLVDCISIILLSVMLAINIIYGAKITMLFVLLSAALYIIISFLHLIFSDVKYILNKKIPSILVIFLCIVSFVLTSWMMPTFTLISPNGKYKVGQISEVMVDTSRKNPYDEKKENRELSVDIYYPTDKAKDLKTAVYIDGEAMSKSLGLPSFAGSYFKNIKTSTVIDAPIAKNDEKFPLVIFSHGMGSIPQAYMSVIEETASNGYVVVCLNHTQYSMFSKINNELIRFKAVDVDRELGLPEKGSSQLIKDALAVWSSDVEFVINEIRNKRVAPEIANDIDSDNIAVMGHSFGGSTAADVLYRDAGIKAGINLDGAIYGDALNGVAKPFMFIISDRMGVDYNKIAKSGGNAEKVKGIIEHFFSSTDALKNNSKDEVYRITINGSSHSSFSDMLLYAPFKYFDQYPAQIEPNKALALTNKYIIGFLNEKLKLAGSQVKAIKQGPEVIVEFKDKVH